MYAQRILCLRKNTTILNILVRICMYVVHTFLTHLFYNQLLKNLFIFNKFCMSYLPPIRINCSTIDLSIKYREVWNSKINYIIIASKWNSLRAKISLSISLTNRCINLFPNLFRPIIPFQTRSILLYNDALYTYVNIVFQPHTYSQNTFSPADLIILMIINRIII